MSSVIEAVKRAARAAHAKRARALQGKGVRTSDAALADAIKMLAREGICNFPKIGDYGLVEVDPGQFRAIGLEAKMPDPEPRTEADGEG